MISGIYLEFLGFIEILSSFAGLFLFLFPFCATLLKYISDVRGLKSGNLNVHLTILRNSMI